MTAGDSLSVRELGADELDGWDEGTVDPPGGNVYQSLAWAAYRERHGWRPRYLAFDDGFRLLSLERTWPWIGGSGAYLSRGPIAAGDAPERTAERLDAAARLLASAGVDVVSSDAEIEAQTGYPALIEAKGFRQIEEFQPSRHRMRLALEPGTNEDELFRSFGSTLRQLIRGAEKQGLRVVRYDAHCGDGPDANVGEGFEAPPAGALGEASRDTFAELYNLLEAAAIRRSFHLGSREAFLDWSVAGLTAGHTIYLAVLDPDSRLLGGATFYRHGGRLTYSHSGDRADLRREHPGVVRLILWRAIQLTIRDGLGEVDFAGVDVAGARRVPDEGEEMYGLYSFKRSFGAEWVELAGNHERVVRPWRYFLGRVTGRLAAATGRRR
jgi:lipid II:glycine glycyltransferase (peptidoglycan interpeptide bridge formation enzyme)